MEQDISGLHMESPIRGGLQGCRGWSIRWGWVGSFSGQDSRVLLGTVSFGDRQCLHPLLAKGEQTVSFGQGEVLIWTTEVFTREVIFKAEESDATAQVKDALTGCRPQETNKSVLSR